MKQKELNRLGHFMMMQTAQSGVEAVRIFEDIKNETGMTDKDKAGLYEQIIRGSTINVKNIAIIMHAAGENSNFRFKRKHLLDMTIADVANALGVKIKCNCEEKEKVSEPKKDDFTVTEIKLPKDKKDELLDMLMSIVKNNEGKK